MGNFRIHVYSSIFFTELQFFRMTSNDGKKPLRQIMKWVYLPKIVHVSLRENIVE